MEQQNVYVIVSNYETRTKIHSVAVKDAAVAAFKIIESGKPDYYIKEQLGPFNFKYYVLDSEGNKNFIEQLYMERMPLLTQLM